MDMFIYSTSHSRIYLNSFHWIWNELMIYDYFRQQMVRVLSKPCETLVKKIHFLRKKNLSSFQPSRDHWVAQIDSHACLFNMYLLLRRRLGWFYTEPSGFARISHAMLMINISSESFDGSAVLCTSFRPRRSWNE